MFTSGEDDDDDGLETTVLVARDATDECDGRVARGGEELGVVVAVDGEDVDVGDLPMKFGIRMSLLALTGS